MNAEWWESPCRFLCKFWWILLLVLLLLLAAFFTRNLWLPAAPAPTAAPVTGFQNVRVSQRKIEIMLRDNGQQVDGDRIKVTVNGQVLVEDCTLTATAQSFSVQLKKGDNTVVVQALNEGSVPPNTSEVSITHVVSGPAVQLSKELNTGETESFIITAP